MLPSAVAVSLRYKPEGRPPTAAPYPLPYKTDRNRGACVREGCATSSFVLHYNLSDANVCYKRSRIAYLLHYNICDNCLKRTTIYLIFNPMYSKHGTPLESPLTSWSRSGMRGLVGGFLAPSSHLPFITFSSHFRSLGAAGSTVNSFSMKAEGGGGASYPASASSKFFPPAMIPEDVQLQIEAVYGMANPPKVALSTAGGGGHALAWLLGVPGASRCLMEAYVP
jgi:hypothetical protein